MSENVYPVPTDVASHALIDNDAYLSMYKQSVEDPEAFWGEHGKRLDWIKPFTKVKNTSFDYHNVSIKWFEDGTLNVSANCIDRHLEKRGDQTAIIWEGDDPADDEHITYSQLHERVSKLANAYKEMGVGKGESHHSLSANDPGSSLCYAGFGPHRRYSIPSSLAAFRLMLWPTASMGAKPSLWLQADQGPARRPDRSAKNQRGHRALKRSITTSRRLSSSAPAGDVPMTSGRDFWYEYMVAKASADCPPEPMNAEDPLFILYTSGSTGKPKGVVHTTGGYLVYASMTHQYVFDYHEGDIYWCTADVGWVTGHSYIVYGPLANGATTLMFEGVPNYPSPSRFWDVCDKHKVNIFYTAPTAIRSLMGAGSEHVEKADLSSLRILGSVGEPINPEAWKWYYEVVGKERCPIVDTWWQTETGGILITPLPGATDLKPGSATRPFFGVQPVMLDNMGNEIGETACEGVLCIADSWPGQMRTVYGDHDRFVSTYFETFKGYYFTGDGARRDADGYYWITGRVDDVINVSGHRMGTAEVESALVAHEKVSEAAVVGYPHDIKGQGIYVYVTLMEGEEESEELRKELRNWVRHEIGPIASPDLIQFAPGLPKTRSGKIMRRILRKIAEDDFGSLGDTSTLADPTVVEDLIDNRQNR